MNDQWRCPNCGLVARDLSDSEIAKRRTYDIFKRQQEATKGETILLGQLVNGHLLQAGIALAVAHGVWHWANAGTWKEKKIWTVYDIIEMLKANTKLLVHDPDDILSLKGVQVGTTTKFWVERADYVQAILLLGAQQIDIMRQVRG